jgi:hypothetical protein
MSHPLIEPHQINLQNNRRNQLINGNFSIWQRGTSLNSSTGGRYLADRWKTVSVGSTYTSSRQPFTLGQTVVPNAPLYYHRNVVTSVAGAGNYTILQQHIEDVTTFANDYCTFSLWVKAATTGNIAIELTQFFGTGGSTQINIPGGTFPVTTSWTKIVGLVFIPSITGKVIGTADDDYVSLNIWLDAGSNYNSRTNSLGQHSGTFDIAQSQVETGKGVSPYENKQFYEELPLCQRYFEKSYELNTVPGTITNTGANVLEELFVSNTAHGFSLVPFNVLKRKIPTITTYSVTTGAAGKAYVDAGSGAGIPGDFTTASIGGGGTKNLGFWSGTTAAGSNARIYLQWTADADI